MGEDRHLAIQSPRADGLGCLGHGANWPENASNQIPCDRAEQDGEDQERPAQTEQRDAGGRACLVSGFLHVLLIDLQYFTGDLLDFAEATEQPRIIRAAEVFLVRLGEPAG